jgi:Zn-dependent protease with chaperone function
MDRLSLLNIHQIIAASSWVGLLFWAGGTYVTQPYVVVFGILIWGLCANPTASLFVGRVISGFPNEYRRQTQRVVAQPRTLPDRVNKIALKLGYVPPKSFRVIESNRMFADTTYGTLTVSSSLYDLSWTSVWDALIGHELYHNEEFSTGRVTRQFLMIGVFFIATFTMLTFLMGSDSTLSLSFAMLYSSAATMVLVYSPISHRSEHNADLSGDKAAGANAMVNLLNLVDSCNNSRGTTDASMSHPSTSQRIRRLNRR